MKRTLIVFVFAIVKFQLFKWNEQRARVYLRTKDERIHKLIGIYQRQHFYLKKYKNAPDKYAHMDTHTYERMTCSILFFVLVCHSYTAKQIIIQQSWMWWLLSLLLCVTIDYICICEIDALNFEVGCIWHLANLKFTFDYLEHIE